MSQHPDVIVVGAGVAGAATTYYLAKAGKRVLLLEAERPAFGASGRNPGFLWLQTKHAGVQMQLALAGRAFADGLADEVGDFGFRASGASSSIAIRASRPSPRPSSPTVAGPVSRLHTSIGRGSSSSARPSDHP